MKLLFAILQKINQSRKTTKLLFVLIILTTFYHLFKAPSLNVDKCKYYTIDEFMRLGPQEREHERRDIIACMSYHKNNKDNNESMSNSRPDYYKYLDIVSRSDTGIFPDHINSMQNLFESTYNFNSPLSHWNVSSITNMSAMFDSTVYFNQAIDKWNVSNSQKYN